MAQRLADIRIIVVDDAEESALLLAALLATEGAVTTAYADPRAALTALTIAAADVVITDLAMPGLDGYGLLAALRVTELNADTPALVMSGLGTPQSIQSAGEAGFAAYVLKPVNFQELIATVVKISKGRM